MLRRLVKTAVACGIRWSGAGPVPRAPNGSGAAPWVVAYHRVVDDFESSARDSIAPMLISRRMLETHLDWIGRRFAFVSLDEIGTGPEGGGANGRPAAAITFDDGYSDVYHQAFPILKRKGIPAAVFVVTDLVGTPRIPLHDRLHLLLTRAFSVWASPAADLARLLEALGTPVGGLEKTRRQGLDALGAMRLLLEALPQEKLQRVGAALEEKVTIDEGSLGERRLMTWEMLADMRRAGITIGSHSRAHPLLTNESRAKVLEEIAGSRGDLGARLGVEIRHFAYPNGWFDAATVRAVAAAGYRWAYTSCRHRDPAHPGLTIPRTLLWQSSTLGPFGRFSPSLMTCQARGTFDGLSGCRLDHGSGFIPDRWTRH